MRRGFFYGGLMTLGTLIPAEACHTATQVTVTIGTDAKCQSQPDAGDHLVDVAVVAGQPHGVDSTPSGTTRDCEAADARFSKMSLGPNQVGTLVIVPRADKDGSAEVVVAAGVTPVDGKPGLDSATCLDRAQNQTMMKDDPCIIARRRLGFVPHSKLELPIQLDTLCVGVVCDADSTCYAGQCVSADAHCDPETGQCELGSSSSTVTSSSAGGGATSSGSGSGTGGGGATSASVTASSVVTTVSGTGSTGVTTTTSGSGGAGGGNPGGCGCTGDMDCEMVGCTGGVPHCNGTVCGCQCDSGPVFDCASTLINAGCTCLLNCP